MPDPGTSNPAMPHNHHVMMFQDAHELCSGLVQDALTRHACVVQMLMEESGGVVPHTFEGLEALPGVGHKTASVVICTAFGYVIACAAMHCDCVMQHRSYSGIHTPDCSRDITVSVHGRT